MVTKLNERKTGGRRTPDSKRVTFDQGQAKAGDRVPVPMKTSDVKE